MKNKSSIFSNKRNDRNTRRRKNKRRGGYVSKGEENYFDYMKLYEDKDIRNTREAINYAIEESKKRRKTRQTRQNNSKLDKMYLGQLEYLDHNNLRSTRDILEHFKEDTDKKTKTIRNPIKDVKPSGFVKVLREVKPDGKDYKQTGVIFDLIETGGGGDCFFHTIAYLVFGDKNKHYEVRRSMVNWVDNNRDKIINQHINGLPIYILMSIQGGGGNKKQIAGSYKNREEQNRVIDNYIRRMGRRGNWAEGVLEYYFVCKSLFDKYGKKVKMMVYTFPCIPDPEVKYGKKCLRNIKDGYRENFCTIVPGGQIQNTIFKDDERGLIIIYVMNKNQGHYQALLKSA